MFPASTQDLAPYPQLNNFLGSFVDQAPLSVQQELLKGLHKQKSQESNNKIKLFIKAHLEHHFAKIKHILMLKNNKEKTVLDLDLHDQHQTSLALIKRISHAQKLSDLDDQLQRAIEATIKEKLAMI